MQGWIEVRNKLPEPWQDVLILMYFDGRMYVACYMGEDDHWGWEIQSNCNKCAGPPEEVTHWMPLPTEPEKYED